VSYDGSTGVCCDASECYSGSDCCGRWGNGGCFYDSNLCSTNECGDSDDTCDYGYDDDGNCLYGSCDYGYDDDGNCLYGSCDYGYDDDGNCLPGSCDYGYDDDGNCLYGCDYGTDEYGDCLPGENANPVVPPAPRPDTPSGPVVPPSFIITPYGVSGTISLLDASVTPVVCKDIDFYYQCAQSYTVQVSGSKMTLTPSSSAPSSCGVGTGDISGTLMLVNARHRRD
jgi:hypothetical protein